MFVLCRWFAGCWLAVDGLLFALVDVALIRRTFFSAAVLDVLAMQLLCCCRVRLSIMRLVSAVVASILTRHHNHSPLPLLLTAQHSCNDAATTLLRCTVGAVAHRTIHGAVLLTPSLVNFFSPRTSLAQHDQRCGQCSAG